MPIQYPENIIEHTFTGIYAIGPRVFKICVVFLAALLEPSAAAKTTTKLAGTFLVVTTFGTCVTGFYRDGRRGDFWHCRVRVGEADGILLVAIQPSRISQFNIPRTQ